MKFLIPSAVLLSAILLGGCKKFLDQDPDSNRATLESPEQVSQLLVSAYPQGNYITIVEAMSDNADDKTQGGVIPANEDSYKYRIVNADANTQDSPDNYWSSAYAAIASANQALATIAKVSNPEAYSSQKGEALLARAYAHFMLVNLYSQFYDPAGSNESMGVPYVDEPEDIVNKQYDRKTVKYVYDRIQQDLEEGLQLVEDKYYDVPRYHFTKASANAFAARFYLYKKDYAKVLEHTNNVFPGVDIQLALRPWNTEWAAYAYQELWTNYSKATTTSNLLLVETYSLWGRYNYSYRYAATNAILTRAWSIKGAVNGNPTWTFERKLYTAGAGNYLLPKLTEYFKANSINANFGQPLVMVPLFDAEEVLFNRAEANAYLGKYDAVLSDLNKYVSQRIQNYVAATHTVTEAKVQSYGAGLPLQEAYIKTIIDFRRMEFLFQGLRWFDMQRYKMPVTHTWRTENNTSTETVTLPAGDPRRVLQLPTSVGLSGVPLNPR
jgi:hypothetical protein